MIIEDAQVVGIDYTNYRGERSFRKIVPLSMRFGANEFHTEKQWLLLAYDLTKQAEREFAMDCIHRWDK
jgi:predicted DNA-binding transcriptional regulator YafY